MMNFNPTLVAVVVLTVLTAFLVYSEIKKLKEQNELLQFSLDEYASTSKTVRTKVETVEEKIQALLQNVGSSSKSEPVGSNVVPLETSCEKKIEEISDEVEIVEKFDPTVTTFENPNYITIVKGNIHKNGIVEADDSVNGLTADITGYTGDSHSAPMIPLEHETNEEEGKLLNDEIEDKASSFEKEKKMLNISKNEHCKALTKGGRVCGNKVKGDNQYCKKHAKLQQHGVEKADEVIAVLPDNRKTLKGVDPMLLTTLPIKGLNGPGIDAGEGIMDASQAFGTLGKQELKIENDVNQIVGDEEDFEPEDEFSY